MSYVIYSSLCGQQFLHADPGVGRIRFAKDIVLGDTLQKHSGYFADLLPFLLKHWYDEWYERTLVGNVQIPDIVNVMGP